MKKKIIAKYNNGNYKVQILSDGTKIRYTENNEFKPEFPESIDVKITDYCDMGCAYCHELSTPKGEHADLDVLLEVLKPLVSGTELAIGGGNPLAHPILTDFLHILKERGIIVNITINQGHLKEFEDKLTNLITWQLVQGIGISITSNDYSVIKRLKGISNNIVYHVIVGINPISIIEDLKSLGNCKVLLLGYKIFGRGIGFYNETVKAGIESWKKALPNIFNNITISFDNLAIEQLEVEKVITPSQWKQFYMGDDFIFTMYIDAVKQEYAPTSRDSKRVSFSNKNLIQYFKDKI